MIFAEIILLQAIPNFLEPDPIPPPNTNPTIPFFFIKI